MNKTTKKPQDRQLAQGMADRPRMVAPGSESALQTMANGSARVRQLMHQQQFARSAGKTAQLLTSGTDLTKPRLGAVAEVMTPLKPWDDGEFYARDRSNPRKDHVHAHVWKATGTAAAPAEGKPAEAVVEGHVVTAKGAGDDRAKRNLTKHTLAAARSGGGRWELTADRKEKRSELPGGSPEVPLAAHDAEDDYTWGHVSNAVRILLNMPDGLTGLADEAAAEITEELDAEKRAAAAAKAAAAVGNDDADDADSGLSLLF